MTSLKKGTFISLLGTSLLTVSLNASAGRVDNLLSVCKKTGKRALERMKQSIQTAHI